MTELFTVLNSNNLNCYKIDRREIGDQHHLYHHMTRIQITQKSWKPLLSSADMSVIITILASSMKIRENEIRDQDSIL